MKKFYYLFLIIFTIFASCAFEKKVTRTSFLLDTFCSVTVYGTTDPSLAEDSLEIVRNYQQILSPFNPESELVKLNTNKSHIFDWELIQLFQTALFVGEKSNEKFDITMGELRDLWSVKNENPQIPSKVEIDKVLAKTGHNQIKITERLVEIGEGQIDLGAIAKGFITDKIVNFLKANDVERAIINLGGNVYTLNSTEYTPWKIGIKSPLINEKRIVCIVKTMNESVVTSGKYERYFEKDGKIYHHVFDTATGMPVQNSLLSVTIINTDSSIADAFSTALLCTGLEEGIKIAKEHNLEAIFITEDKAIYMPRRINSKVLLSDDRFSIEYY